MNKFLIMIIASFSLHAQDLDSLYNEILNAKHGFKSNFATTHIEDKQHEKCGFGLLATVKEYFYEFNIQQQNKITELMARPELNSNIVSPSGLFKIHYDQNGVNQPNYSISELAEAFDSSYNYEVNILGYPAPPTDGNLGGDDKYDVYILNLGGGLYGATTPETTIGEGKYISYIEIDNSFSKNEGYNSYGIDGAKVTAAHEFHHAIQLGNYIFRSEDTYYYELTSTAFEEFVYDEVNDYYAYIPSYFNTTRNRLEDNTGYDLAIWNIFLQERFKDSEDPMLGHKIVKRSWEHLVNNRAAVAVAEAMNDFNKSFLNEFNEFADWIYFTNYRAKNDEFFEEAENYPLVRSTYNFDLDNEQTLNLQSNSTSINYLTFFDYSQGFADTIVAVLSNSDVSGAADNKSLDVQFTISNSLIDGASSINDSYFSKIEGEGTEFIQSSYIINNELSDITVKRTEIDFTYPQPFNYELNNVLSIPTFPDPSENAELKIFSSDMNLVYSGSETIISNENIVVKWDGLSKNGEKLASGVYVYVTQANGKIKKGKFVILN